MTIIQNSTIIAKPIDSVYEFLANLNNHEQLMPENIVDWNSSVDEASFAIKNMAKLSLKINQRTANTMISCVPSGEAPFEIKLSWHLEDLNAESVKATFIIEAKLNMMMKMMASGPLQKLVDHQVKRLNEVFA